jgi:hypothetical protein
MEAAMAAHVSAPATPRIRHNYFAIGAAAIASFLLEAVWYSVFLNAWMAGIGRSMEWLHDNSPNFGVQLAIALASAALMAVGIDCIVQLTGPQTALRGIKVGALLWLGFELTVFSTEYVFEVRPWSLFGVNAGFWLLSIVMMGAIVGGWKKR